MMRALHFAVLATIALLASGTFREDSLAQEQKASALPLPEMQRLAKFYVGTWTYTETYPKSRSLPNGAVNTGIYTSELGPGGNSIFNRFHSKGPAGESEGVLVMTWDPKEKAYKAFVLGDSFPGAITETGQFEGEALVYRGEFSMGAVKLALRNSTTLTSDGKIISEEFAGANGAPESLVVRVEAVKK
jgi:hypothetical protein